MGLDSIEIVMKVEQAFQIKIADREAEKIITIGDFYDCVCRHLHGLPGNRCRSQMLFYTLRRAAVVQLNITQDQFTPQSDINRLFPKPERRKVYARFATATGMTFPSLILARPWMLFLCAATLLLIGGGLVAAVMLIASYNYSYWALLLPVAGGLLATFISRLLQPLRTVIDAASVRDFIQQVLANNYGKVDPKSDFNRKEVEEVINYIIADHMGIDPKDITPEKKIADDLGVC